MASNSDSVSLKKRGRAYQCRKCEYLGSSSDTRWHFIKNHVPLHKVPYHYSLCQYRAKDRKMLHDHVKTWRPHAKQAKARKLDPDSTECLVEVKESYEIICCEDEDKVGDITILSLKESCEEWSKRQRSSERNSVETPKNKIKSKSKKDRDLEYAMKILREQGVEFTVGKPSMKETAVKETKTEEKTEDEQEPVITVDCVRLTDTDDRCSSSSSNSESEQSEDEDKTAVGNLIKVMEDEQIDPTDEGRDNEMKVGTSSDVVTEKQEEPEAFTLAAPTMEEHLNILQPREIKVQLNQDEIISTMAEVVEATIKTSLDKVRKLKETADGDLYSIMTSVGSQMLNTNCNLADVAHSLDKNLLKAGETKDEMAKLNRQVWDVKNELGKVNNNLINMTRSLDALNATQKANGGKLNSMLETVVTSQKILANCIANQTQAFKEMRANRDDQHKNEDRKAEGNSRKRSHDRRGVSPLRALNGFDTLYSEEKRRRNNDENRLPIPRRY